MPQYRSTISGRVVTTDGPDPAYDNHVRWRRVDDDGEAAEGAAGADVEAPPGNASTEDWQAYAVSRGMDEAEAHGKTRKELRELYGG